MEQTYRQERITFPRVFVPRGTKREMEAREVDASTIKRPVLRLSDTEPRETFFVSAS